MEEAKLIGSGTFGRVYQAAEHPLDVIKIMDILHAEEDRDEEENSSPIPTPSPTSPSAPVSATADTVDPSTPTGQRVVCQNIREAIFLRNFVHPGIVRVRKIELDSVRLQIRIHMKNEGISIDRWVRTTPKRATRVARLPSIIGQIADVLAFTAKLGIMHGDLSSANVLIQPRSGKITVIDWGSVCFFPPGREYNYCTAMFCPPEEEAEEFHPLNDIYSLGCLCCFIVSGRYSKRPEQGPLQSVRPAVAQLIRRMIAPLETRISALHILQKGFKKRPSGKGQVLFGLDIPAEDPMIPSSSRLQNLESCFAEKLFLFHYGRCSSLDIKTLVLPSFQTLARILLGDQQFDVVDAEGRKKISKLISVLATVKLRVAPRGPIS